MLRKMVTRNRVLWSTVERLLCTSTTSTCKRTGVSVLVWGSSSLFRLITPTPRSIGLVGSTRPTHYYVVHDEIGIGADQLQGLTNDVSYMFARATKAVSLVSPAYYADLACERGRCYIHSLLQGISDSGATGTSGSGEDEVMAEAKKLWRFDNSPNAVGGALKDTMFYI